MGSTVAPAPVIVSAEFGAADFAWLDGLRRAHYPPERNVVAAHLTLFHHLPPSLVPELSDRLRAEVRSTRRPPAMIGEPLLLDRGVALRVRSEALMATRVRLAEAFAGLLTLQDAAAWRPHVTIQNKVEPAVARRLHARLEAELPRFRPLVIAGLASFSYRDGLWELIHRHRF